MREIKFRGKRLDTQEWVEGYYWHNIQDDRHNIVILAPANGFVSGQIQENARVRLETIGQFTGLTDKNGKEIFEGDVLSNSFMDNKKGKNGIASFKEHCFCIECEELYRPIGNDLGWSNMKGNKWYGEIEVIGSIHDNPELIQQP